MLLDYAGSIICLSSFRTMVSSRRLRLAANTAALKRLCSLCHDMQHLVRMRGALTRRGQHAVPLKHDPEKCEAVFRIMLKQ
ncbi:hypothetical protein AOQ71_05455 [Bradyrhizobium manausense]|uniref:Uncharacterized protein n=1 Tax=Bradyrhizobium manausense TaxID=989370 RepID=A0A0R3E9U6_9BRAD|nr:hypothetical protein AOQ71_05455 [Bradyrhizobium manausense]